MTITDIKTATPLATPMSGPQPDMPAGNAADGFEALLRDVLPNMPRRDVAAERGTDEPGQPTFGLAQAGRAQPNLAQPNFAQPNLAPSAQAQPAGTQTIRPRGADERNTMTSGSGDTAAEGAVRFAQVPLDMPLTPIALDRRAASAAETTTAAAVFGRPERVGEANARRPFDDATEPEKQSAAPPAASALPLALLGLSPPATEASSAPAEPRRDVAPAGISTRETKQTSVAETPDWSVSFGLATDAAVSSEPPPMAGSEWLAVAAQSGKGALPRMPASASFTSIEIATHHAPQATPAAKLEASMQQVAMKAAGEPRPPTSPIADFRRASGAFETRRDFDLDQQQAIARPAVAAKSDPTAMQPPASAIDRTDAPGDAGSETQTAPPVATQVADAIAAAASTPASGTAPGRGTPGAAAPGSQAAHTAGTSNPLQQPAQAGTDDVVKSLRVKLHPVELGEVDVRLSLHGDTLRVKLRLEASEAAQALQSSQSDLTQALSGHGLRLEGLVIDVTQAARPADQRAPAAGATPGQAFDTFTGSAGAGHSGRESARRDTRGEPAGTAPSGVDRGARDTPEQRRSALYL